MAFGQRGDGTPAVYDLGPPAAPRPAASAWPLALEVRAPAWLDSPQIRYRLAYAEAKRLRVYSRARWVGPPAQLLRQRLEQRLGLLPPGQGGAACLLRIDLDEFSQVFATPEQSHGVVCARLTWLDRKRQTLAEGAPVIEQAAPSPDARGGVAALAAAVDRLGGEIARRQEELAGSGRLKACGK